MGCGSSRAEEVSSPKPNAAGLPANAQNQRPTRDDAVGAKLRELGLGQYADTFQSEGFDELHVLQSMSREEMQGVCTMLGMKTGHAFKLMTELLGPASPSVTESSAVARPLAPTEEPTKAINIKPADSTRCKFLFLKASALRETRLTRFGRSQDLLREHPEWFEWREMTLEGACRGDYRKQYASISHRWESSKEPDTTGCQLAAAKKYAMENPQIRWFWCDFWCLPQGDRTEAEADDFMRMLRCVNLLYLGTSVLILLDLSYLSRFWTQFEAWLSFQSVEGGKLRGSAADARRCHIVCLHNAAGTKLDEQLVTMWANRSAAQAYETLSAPDIAVTNQSDKAEQLPKILALEALVASVSRAPAAAASTEEQDLLASLIAQVAAGNADATGALADLASVSDSNKMSIAAAGAIAPLVALLSEGSAHAKAQAADVLWRLAVNKDNQVKVAAAGAIKPLVALLSEGDVEAIGDAALALANLAANKDNQVSIAAAGAIKPLVALLSEGSTLAKNHASLALSNLAMNQNSRVSIAAAGAIVPLVALLRNGTAKGKEYAAGAVCSLAFENEENQVGIVEAGAIVPLMKVLKEGSAGAKERAAGAVATLSMNEDVQERLAADATAPIVEMLSEGDAIAKETAASAVAGMACDDNNQVSIAAAGAIPPLVALLSGEGRVRDTAAAALAALAINEDNRVSIAAAGAIAPLVSLFNEGDEWGGSAGAALNMLQLNPENEEAMAKLGYTGLAA